MSRPVLGLVLRAGAVLLPVVVSVAAALATAALLPAVTSVWATILWWAAVLLVAQTCLLATAYAARQLLPLAVLLRMSLLFPDRAPSRFRVWRSVGSADALERRVEAGADPTGARDAALMLGLVRAVGHHDPATRGHSERVRLFVDLIAEELRLAAGDHDRLRWVALLHDVGKLSVAPEVLNKPGRLDGAEWAQVHKHPAEGARLTAPLGPWLGAWAPGVRDHHERYDGSGYPAGLGGAEISFAGRIVAVADAFETMTARRPYKRPLTVAAARRELVRCAGSHFDPQVVRALLNVSIGRLRRRVGTMALLIQIPLVGRLVDRAPAGAGQTLVAALILATLAAVGIMDPASGPAGAPGGSGQAPGPPLGMPPDAGPRAGGPPVPTATPSPVTPAVELGGGPGGARTPDRQSAPAARGPQGGPPGDPAPAGTSPVDRPASRDPPASAATRRTVVDVGVQATAPPASVAVDAAVTTDRSGGDPRVDASVDVDVPGAY